MKDRLVAAINEIRNDRLIVISDEASIKAGVVLRLLSMLGWNQFDVNEVKERVSGLENSIFAHPLRGIKPGTIPSFS